MIELCLLHSFDFYRDVPTARKYYERKCEIRTKWRSVDDYCKHTYLSYPARLLVNGGREVRYVEECKQPRGEFGMCSASCVVGFL